LELARSSVVAPHDIRTENAHAALTNRAACVNEPFIA
jgi:hypothetical protein